MGSGHIITLMVVNMRDLGSMIYKMGRVVKLGRTRARIRVCTIRGRNMVTACMFGVMEQSIKASGSTIKYRALAAINGLMEESTRENGLKTKCMGKVTWSGRMANRTRVPSSTTLNMEWVRISGQKVKNI